MANKVKITDGQGTQVFPITHVSAVIDSNGNSVEQVLGAQTDLIQQAQLEIGAVPSDFAPTENSSNWVTSGGVYNAIGQLENKVNNLFVTTVEDGYYIVDNNLFIGVKVDEDGLHAINSLDYEIIN